MHIERAARGNGRGIIIITSKRLSDNHRKGLEGFGLGAGKLG